MSSTCDRRRVVLRLVALVTIATGLVAGRSPEAGAHARISHVSPADGAVVEALPDSVSITFVAKPATVEGDPVMVYDPTGRRVDDGDARVGDDGQVLSVGLDGATGHLAGRYEILYRVASADTHVLTGRFGFTVTEAAAADEPVFVADAAPVERGRHLRGAGPTDLRPEILAVGVAAALAVTARRRTRRALPRPQPAGTPPFHPTRRVDGTQPDG
jgi:methionine-rich copper-binding protein CopC